MLYNLTRIGEHSLSQSIFKILIINYPLLLETGAVTKKITKQTNGNINVGQL